jgi:DNA-binding IclR family transcriptional regulator
MNIETKYYSDITRDMIQRGKVWGARYFARRAARAALKDLTVQGGDYFTLVCRSQDSAPIISRVRSIRDALFSSRNCPCDSTAIYGG